MRAAPYALAWLAGVLAAAGSAPASDRIDRSALVHRHNPTVHKADPLATLSLGNGSFAFGVDVTGLQTFPEFYDKGIPLCTESYWGWHTFPNPENHRLSDCLVDFDCHGRVVPYLTRMNTKAGEWLRSNPHRLGLGRVGFELLKSDRSAARLEDLSGVDQVLDLWTGVLTSRFIVEGSPVEVQTCCHPQRDVLSVRVESPLVTAKRLAVTIAFAYGSGAFGKEPGDWGQPGRHETAVTAQTGTRADLRRRLDADHYSVSVAFSPGGRCEAAGAHRFRLVPETTGAVFECTIAFAPVAIGPDLPDAAQCRAASQEHWKQFWSDGGAIDLSGSRDPRAAELERRIILSQYLMAIQSAGPMPPPETA